MTMRGRLGLLAGRNLMFILDRPARRQEFPFLPRIAMEAHNHRLSEPAQPWVPGHDVQFYDDEEFLTSVVGRFLVDGVRAGQPVIVIATPSHQQAFVNQMRAMGFDPDHLTPARDIVWLDARETLSAFMEGNRPNPELFEATVGNVFEKVTANRRYALVRAYGEMVDLLWRDGKAEAAIAVEELWNALASKYTFSLLCAYAGESLRANPREDGREMICRTHSRVLPPKLVA
jgi:hypothetical protein